MSSMDLAYLADEIVDAAMDALTEVFEEFGHPLDGSDLVTLNKAVTDVVSKKVNHD